MEAGAGKHICSWELRRSGSCFRARPLDRALLLNSCVVPAHRRLPCRAIFHEYPYTGSTHLQVGAMIGKGLMHPKTSVDGCKVPQPCVHA